MQHPLPSQQAQYHEAIPSIDPYTPLSMVQKAARSSQSAAQAKRSSGPRQPQAARAACKPGKRYTVEKIVGIRRAYDWTAGYPRYQFAIQWEGYLEKTWHTPDVLDIDIMLLKEVTTELDPQNHRSVMTWYEQQPNGEKEGAPFIPERLV